jgi:hypothetical protein
MWAKIGPRWNWKCFPLRLILHDHVRAHDVAGMRSGVNWMRENERSRLSASVLNEEGLAEARHPSQQDVPARERPGEHVIDHLVVPDDDLAHLVAESVEVGDELLDALFLSVRRGGRLRHAQTPFPS